MSLGTGGSRHSGGRLHPVLLRLPEAERPLPGETPVAYWDRIRALPPVPRGPRLLTVETMTRLQRQQYRLRCNAGLSCGEALAAVTRLDTDAVLSVVRSSGPTHSGGTDAPAAT